MIIEVESGEKFTLETGAPGKETFKKADSENSKMISIVERFREVLSESRVIDDLSISST